MREGGIERSEPESSQEKSTSSEAGRMADKMHDDHLVSVAATLLDADGFPELASELVDRFGSDDYD